MNDLKNKAYRLLFDHFGYMPDNLIIDLSAKQYPIILRTINSDEIHFFLYDEIGLLFYDGWDKEGSDNICIN